MNVIVGTFNSLINHIIEEIKNCENLEELKVYDNIIDHLVIFNLLNEVFFHKLNEAEDEYNLIKREVKVLTDNIKKLKINLEKASTEENNKKEILDIKRRLNAFQNSGIQQDVIYETINL